MKLLKLSLLALAAAIFALACNTNTNTPTNTSTTSNANRAAANTTPAPAATPDELASARATFKDTCARCHKETGEGGIADLGEGEKPLKVPSLKEGHAREHTEAQLARTISNGDDGMPSFKKRLSEQQINDLVRFIRREFQSGASAAPSNANAHD